MVIGWLAGGYRIKSNQYIRGLRDAIVLLKMSKQLNIVFRKVKGHSDDAMNRKVDALAKVAARQAADGIF